MAEKQEKQTVVYTTDRPEPPIPADKRVSELQVRDLEVLLQHAILHKHFKHEVEHKHPKWEKYEKVESKFENLKSELGKWEHGEKPAAEVHGVSPVEDLRVLVSAVTQLQSAVTQLSQEVQALKAK